MPAPLLPETNILFKFSLKFTVFPLHYIFFNCTIDKLVCGTNEGNSEELHYVDKFARRSARL